MQKSLNSFKFLFFISFSAIIFGACGGRPKPLPVVPVSPQPLPSVPVVVPTKEPNLNPNPINSYTDLKILSYNVWGLPNPITKDQKRRFESMPEALKGYDIVNLQETFTDNINPVIEKTGYPFYLRMDNGNFLSLNSGLTVLSKYPIVKRDFSRFDDCTNSDCLANKGVLFVRINIPELGDIDVYNTHYQAIMAKEDLRVQANKNLSAFVQKNESGNPTILSGDFNFANTDISDSKSRALKDFKSRFNPLDTFRIANPGLPGFTSDPSQNNYSDKTEPPQRLDYIFVLPENRGFLGKEVNYKVEVVDSKIVFNNKINGLFLSDHFGVATTLRFHRLK